MYINFKLLLTNAKCKQFIVGIFVVLFSFVMTLYFLGGTKIDWNSYPGYHGGDDAGGLAVIRNIMENGLTSFFNEKLAYPEGVDNRIYPPNDLQLVTIVKFISIFTNDPTTVMTWLYIFTLLLAALFMYIVLIKLKCGILLSIVSAELFAFTFQHSLSTSHLNVALYFPVAVALYYAIKLAADEDFVNTFFLRKNLFKHSLVLLLSIQTNLYIFTFFLLVLGIGCMARIIQSGFRKQSIVATCVMFIAFAGIGINLSPSIYGRAVNNYPDALSANSRSVRDSYIYSTHFMQMVLPTTMHRSEVLRNITNDYNSKSDIPVTENMRSSLGFIVSLSFCISLLFLFKFNYKSIPGRELAFLGMCNIIVFCFATIGGLGMFIAYFITPIVRCWNRLTSVITGTSLIFMAIGLKMIFDKYRSSLKKHIITFLSCLLLLTFGLWDQTGLQRYYTNADELKQTKQFYSNLQNELGENSPVYMMPNLNQPYGNQYLSYKQYLSYAYAPKLFFNIGGQPFQKMAIYYDNLSSMPVSKQLNAAEMLNYAAVVIYKDAFPEDGETRINAIKERWGAEPFLLGSNASILAFKNPYYQNSGSIDDVRAIVDNILEQPDNEYLFNSKFLYTKRNLKMAGFSYSENWGIWSLGNNVTIQDILSGDFTNGANVVLDADIFNKDQQIIKIYSQNELLFTIDRDVQLPFHFFIPPNLLKNNELSLTFNILYPKTPASLYGSADERELGIGFKSISITPAEK